jgi:polar amino acid transport system substrate-binding protein
MFIRFLFTILIIIGFSVQALPSKEEKIITLVADPWCPYNCEADSNAPGVVIEIMQTIFEPLGYKIIYEIVDWEYAKTLVSTGKKTALPGMNKRNDANYIYPDKPFVKSHSAFFTIADSKWNFVDADSMNQLAKIMIISGYSYGTVLDEILLQFNNIVEKTDDNNPLKNNINMLLQGRASALIAEKNVMKYYLMIHDLVENFRMASKFPEEGLYIGFSALIDDIKTIIEIYNQEFKKMEEDGRLVAIYQKYGINN